MNKCTVKAVLISIVLAAALVTGCNNIFSPPSGGGAAAAHGTGTVRVSFGLASARTVFPDLATGFAQFVLTFTDEGNTPLVFTLTKDDAKSVTLPVGVYTMRVEAYVDATDADYAAWGEVSNIAVADGGNTPVSVFLTGVADDGDGTFSWNITGLGDAAITAFSMLSISGASVYDLVAESVSNSVPVSAGYYFVTLTASKTVNGKECTAGKNEVVHVYRNAVSQWNPVFDNDEFTRTLSSETTIGSITVNGSVLASDADGIYRVTADNAETVTVSVVTADECGGYTWNGAAHEGNVFALDAAGGSGTIGIILIAEDGTPTTYTVELTWLIRLPRVTEWKGWTIPEAEGGIAWKYDTYTDDTGTYGNVLKLSPNRESGEYWGDRIPYPAGDDGGPTSVGDRPFQYDLSAYEGKTIRVQLSVDVKLDKGVEVLWQENQEWKLFIGDESYYGKIYEPDVWHTLTNGNGYTMTVNFATRREQHDDNVFLYLLGANATRWSGGMGLKSATAWLKNLTLTITDITPVSYIEINGPDTVTLIEGATQSLSVTVKPDTAVDKSITWSSDNEAVATVDTTGVVTAVSAGTATIRASSTADTSKYADFTITVNPASVPVTGITLNASITRARVGEEVVLTAGITPANATNKNVTWEFAANKVDVVSTSADGLSKTVKGLSGGTVTFTVTSDADNTKTASVSVEFYVESSVNISVAWAGDAEVVISPVKNADGSYTLSATNTNGVPYTDCLWDFNGSITTGAGFTFDPGIYTAARYEIGLMVYSGSVPLYGTITLTR